MAPVISWADADFFPRPLFVVSKALHDKNGKSLISQADPPFSSQLLPGSLYEWAIGEMKEGTRGALSIWLTTALNRPDAIFRDETVTFNRRIAGKGKYALRQEEEMMELPAVEPVSPKDLWLAERYLAERRVSPEMAR